MAEHETLPNVNGHAHDEREPAIYHGYEGQRASYQPSYAGPPNLGKRKMDDAQPDHIVKKQKIQIDYLQSELKRLETLVESKTRWPVLYRLRCIRNRDTVTYADPPALVQQDGHHHLDSFWDVPDEELWEDAHAHAPFVVYRTYECENKATNEPVLRKSAITNLLRRESVHILDSSLRHIVHELFQSHEGLRMYLSSGVFQGDSLIAPFTFYYHFASHITGFVSQRKARYPALLRLFEYISEHSAEELAHIQEFISEGVANARTMPYLFRPTDLLLVGIDDDNIAVTQSAVVYIAPESNSWMVHYRRVVFDGLFRQEGGNVAVHLGTGEKRDIRDFPVHPLRFASLELQAALLDRGRQFWNCRYRKFVCSEASNTAGRAVMNETRYMIDIEAYNSIHEGEKFSNLPVIEPREQDEAFLMTLPPAIQGFCISTKEWSKLQVSKFKEVVWNKQAFDDLVIANDDGEDTKELILALVQKKIDADEGIDFVDGKGTGLVMLLHGSPGTGKTLTAESIAEITEKPLYRVTCGDVGATPEAVEEYLESVFELGRRWGCVVLLDEADVFLEERSLNNLKRNALVSVFLRAVEYYDGILILTSNRVGHFDAAFKSRIQLAIPYLPLNEAQQRQIWANFLRKLKDVHEHMDVAEIESRMGELAKAEMNGRQIRNAINTARQLARHRNKKLTFSHLKIAIKASQRFDKYVEGIHEFNDEDWAKEKGDR